jgi:hypothetical protein
MKTLPGFEPVTLWLLTIYYCYSLNLNETRSTARFTLIKLYIIFRPPNYQHEKVLKKMQHTANSDFVLESWGVQLKGCINYFFVWPSTHFDTFHFDSFCIELSLHNLWYPFDFLKILTELSKICYILKILKADTF